MKEATTYEIVIRGHLDRRWTDWFNGMTITHVQGVTVLQGVVADQARLRGMLNKIWDLNLTLLGVRRVPTRQVVSNLPRKGS